MAMRPYCVCPMLIFSVRIYTYGTGMPVPYNLLLQGVLQHIKGFPYTNLSV